jgi:hypothetical protein
MKNIWLMIAVLLGLSAALCIADYSLRQEYVDNTPDMGVVIPYYNPRQACNSSDVGLISRWVMEPYSSKALLCLVDDHGNYGWAELQDVEP